MADNSRKRPFTRHEAVAGNHLAGAAPVNSTAHLGYEGIDDDLEEMDLVPTDAEATIMLLRNKLYPDPAQAAAAASAAKQSRHAKRSKAATGPSKATATAITAAAAAAAAAKQLPPIVLKSQLYTVLSDKTAADRDLEDLRQKGRVRVFKLAIGADEYVVLLADDYLTIINRIIQQHQQLASQHAQQQGSSAATATAAASDSSPGSSAAEAASIAVTLQLFRDHVVPAWRDSSIPRARLLELLRSAQHTIAASASAAGRASARPAAAAAAAAGTARHAGKEPSYERHLLALDLMTRDIRSPDSYVLTVPGAAAFVKSVVAGRQELLQLLSRKKFNEMLEKEVVCIKLRNSCLTPGFITRDLQGRGLITLTDTTAGPLVRLAQRK